MELEFYVKFLNGTRVLHTKLEFMEHESQKKNL